jgi:ABC-type multidrug transport system permease subunit
MLISYYRDESYGFVKILNHVVTGVFNAGAFVQLGNSRTDLQNKVFLCFQITVLIFLNIPSCVTMYHSQRAVFFREDASKMYSPVVFAIAITLAEIPFAILSSVLFFLPIYFMPFQFDAGRALYFWLIALVLQFLSITLAFALSALTPSSFITEQLNPFFLVIMSSFCGVTVPAPDMPAFWRAWMYPLDPITYQIEGLVTTALHREEVVCETQELNLFPPPNGSSCGEYMQPFFATGGPGYLVDSAATDECGYCAYAVGDEYFKPLGFEHAHRWRNYGILWSYTAANVLFLLLAIKFLNFNKR